MLENALILLYDYFHANLYLKFFMYFSNPEHLENLNRVEGPIEIFESIKTYRRPPSGDYIRGMYIWLTCHNGPCFWIALIFKKNINLDPEIILLDLEDLVDLYIICYSVTSLFAILARSLQTCLLVTYIFCYMWE
ncbi:hypothetical protein ACJX0J_016358, partial [Zea mays]